MHKNKVWQKKNEKKKMKKLVKTNNKKQIKIFNFKIAKQLK